MTTPAYVRRARENKISNKFVFAVAGVTALAIANPIGWMIYNRVNSNKFCEGLHEEFNKFGQDIEAAKPAFLQKNGAKLTLQVIPENKEGSFFWKPCQINL
jgi:hypothetical protein